MWGDAVYHHHEGQNYSKKLALIGRSNSVTCHYGRHDVCVLLYSLWKHRTSRNTLLSWYCHGHKVYVKYTLVVMCKLELIVKNYLAFEQGMDKTVSWPTNFIFCTSAILCIAVSWWLVTFYHIFLWCHKHYHALNIDKVLGLHTRHKSEVLYKYIIYIKKLFKECDTSQRT